MLDHMLSSQQLAVICALSSGVNMTTAAEQAGVHRNTITNWRRNLLPFQRALADAQYDRALLFREKLEDQIDLAIQALRDILTDPKASPSVKLRAALTVVTIATTPPPPKKQIELNIETVVVEQNSQTEPQIVPNVAQPAPESEPQIAHNQAQPVPDICVNSRSFAANPRVKVGRNEPCPCRSGKKYKHCCLNSALLHPVAEAA